MPEKELIDEVDLEAARSVYVWTRWAEKTPAAGAGSRRPRSRRERWTPARRRRYLRAAFVGNVEVPFVLIICTLFIFGAGLLAGHGWYVQLERDRLRHEIEREGISRYMRDLERVRGTTEESRQFVEFVSTLYAELERIRRENGR